MNTVGRRILGIFVWVQVFNGLEFMFQAMECLYLHGTCDHLLGLGCGAIMDGLPLLQSQSENNMRLNWLLF